MINIKKLISVSLQLNIQACKIIKQSFLNKNLKKYMKGVDDPVTEADYKVQSMLIKGYREHFPELKIIGQQTKEYQGDIQFDYKTIIQDFLPNNIKFNQELPVDEVCLWIDPIDCTTGFVNGHIEDVTILVGLSHSKKAYAGIVGIPFKKVGDQHIYDPIILFGSIGSQIAYQYHEKQKQYKRLQKVKYQPKQHLIITTSSTHPNPKSQHLIQLLKGQNIRVGGSGRKLIMVARGQADLTFYTNSGTHKWDSCAPQAIIKAIGGYMYDLKNNDLQYDYSNENTNNMDGFFSTLHEQIYKQMLKTLKY